MYHQTSLMDIALSLSSDHKADLSSSQDTFVSTSNEKLPQVKLG